MRLLTTVEKRHVLAFLATSELAVGVAVVILTGKCEE